jgi:chromosome segregation ATPase
MTPWIVAIVAALVGPLLAYVGVARRLSGKIGTSEASDLWEEARSIREGFRLRIEELNDVVRECNERIDALEERNAALFRENENLRYQVSVHERTIATLTEENKSLRKRVEGLEP